VLQHVAVWAPRAFSQADTSCNTPYRIIVETHCKTLQNTATRCNTLQPLEDNCRPAGFAGLCECSRRSHIYIYTYRMFTGAVGAFTRSLHCNTLLHAAARCPTLERNAIYCNTCVPTGHDTCNTLQNTSTHCHTLPHTAIQCNTMQYMCTNRI